MMSNFPEKLSPAGYLPGLVKTLKDGQWTISASLDGVHNHLSPTLPKTTLRNIICTKFMLFKTTELVDRNMRVLKFYIHEAAFLVLACRL